MALSFRNYSDLTLSQIMVAVQFVFYKFVLSSVEPTLFMGLRFGLSAVIIFMMRRVLKETATFESSHPTQKWTSRDLGFIVLQAVLGGVFFNLILSYGIEMTTATSAGIIGSSLPAVIALLSFIFLKEKLNFSKVLAIFLVVLGIVVLNLDNTVDGTPIVDAWKGDCLVFLAMIPEAAYTIIVRYSKGRVQPSVAAMGVGIVCALCFLIIGFFQGTVWSTLLDWTLVQWAILFGSAMTCVVFFILWSRALKEVPANTAGLFGGIMPIASTILAVFFLGEHFGIYDFLGLMIIISSIVLGTQDFKFRTSLRPMVDLKLPD